MDLANLGTCAAIDTLGPFDEVGVIAVDSAAHVVTPLTSASEKESICNQARTIQSMGGGIFTYTALVSAATMVQQSEKGTRHIVLFADAADAEEPGEYQRLLERIQPLGITVSVIGLGAETDVDAEFLKDVAQRGGGRALFTTSAEELPRLFAQEAITVARSSFVDRAHRRSNGVRHGAAGRTAVLIVPGGRWLQPHVSEAGGDHGLGDDRRASRADPGLLASRPGPDCVTGGRSGRSVFTAVERVVRLRRVFRRSRPMAARRRSSAGRAGHTRSARRRRHRAGGARSRPRPWYGSGHPHRDGRHRRSRRQHHTTSGNEVGRGEHARSALPGAARRHLPRGGSPAGWRRAATRADQSALLSRVRAASRSAGGVQDADRDGADEWRCRAHGLGRRVQSGGVAGSSDQRPAFAVDAAGSAAARRGDCGPAIAGVCDGESVDSNASPAVMAWRPCRASRVTSYDPGTDCGWYDDDWRAAGSTGRIRCECRRVNECGGRTHRVTALCRVVTGESEGARACATWRVSRDTHLHVAAAPSPPYAAFFKPS